MSRPGHPAGGRPAAPGTGAPAAPGGPAGAGQVPGVPGPARHTPPPAAPPGVPTGPAGGVPAAPSAPPAYPGTPPPVQVPAAPGGDTPAGLAPGTPPGPGVPLGPGVDPATGTAGAPWGVHGRTGTAPAAQVPWAPGSGAEPPATGAGAGGGAAPSPQLLPRPPAGFLGRAAELDQLTRLALPGAAGPGTADSALVLVTGPAGVGKTALAVRWAHSHAEAFPHGRLFADLRGFGGGEEARPGQVLREFLLALGVEAGRIPESADAAAALYRSIAADRALLVVLDNAHSSAQVRPLLPAGPYCVTLVTSRSRLDGLVATDSARSVRLHALDIEEGVALLGAVLGQDRVTEDPAAARELVALCNGLPLALRAAAAQLTARPRWRLARLAAALRDERKRLALLSAEDTGVAAALRASVARLSADDVRLLATLGSSFAREVDAGAVAALAGSDPELTRDALDRLAEVHLIDEEATNRYVMSDLVKLFAQEGKDRPGPGERPG
ncbi:ATP-binding protein [Streptomyces pactum]|uniref:ATP-binding protein n=1 Tax=Streptomyces pactum TaxID=68249 RepID=A0ABS0NLG5_9ACTN|nr:ATP-binding protein [Streptomyces pactum]